jgi:hypothetical protein
MNSPRPVRGAQAVLRSLLATGRYSKFSPGPLANLDSATPRGSRVVDERMGVPGVLVRGGPGRGASGDATRYYRLGPEIQPTFKTAKQTTKHGGAEGERQTMKPPARRIGTPIPGPGRIGKRGFPQAVSRPNRDSETGFPAPKKKPGNRGSDSRFPSDVRASTAVDSEYTAGCTHPRVSCHRDSASARTGSMRLRVLFRVRERNHAAAICQCLPRLRKVASSGSRNLPVA